MLQKYPYTMAALLYLKHVIKRKIMADVKNIDEVLIIGGGASGMMAAIIAARNGKKVAIIEKNEKLGKKLFITGKGRCNYTNACDIQTLIESCVANPKFMYGSFRGFDS